MSRRPFRWDTGLQVRVLGLLAFLLMLVVGLGVTLSLTFLHVEQLQHRADQTQQNLVMMGKVIGSFTEMTSALRGYLLAGESVFIQPFNAARYDVTGGLAHLRQSAGDDPEQGARLDRIATVAEEWIRRVAEPEIAAKRSGSPDAGKIVIAGAGLRHIADIRAFGMEYMEIESRRLALEVAGAQAAAAGRQRLVWISVSVAGLLTLAGFLVFARSVRRSIGQLVDVAERIAAGERGVQISIPLEGEFQIVAEAFSAMSVTVAAQEERLRAQNQELAQLDRLKSEFVSTVSHELRTPLTSITGYLHLLLNGQAGEIQPLQREFLEIVSRNTSRLAMLINDLLDIQRIESGRTPIQRHPVRMAEVIRHAAETFRFAASQKGLAFVLDLPDGAGPLVEGDRDRLEQVVSNLLSNAVKYTREGEIRTSLLTAEGAAMLEVWDTGVGISSGEHGRVFERFFRGEHQYVREAGGTGLGLAIVRALVAEHGGRVEFESSPGQGSCFRVILPVMEAH